MSDNDDEIRQKIHDLKVEHSDLDEVINLLVDNPVVDQIRLKRLKKRKLLLKDLIQRLESKLIPDMDA
jgi:hypothetical protein